MVSALGKQRHEEGKFEASLGCIARACLKVEWRERKY